MQRTLLKLDSLNKGAILIDTVLYILNRVLFSIAVFTTFIVFIVATGCVGSTVLIDTLTKDRFIKRTNFNKRYLTQK